MNLAIIGIKSSVEDTQPNYKPIKFESFHHESPRLYLRFLTKNLAKSKAGTAQGEKHRNHIISGYQVTSRNAIGYPLLRF